MAGTADAADLLPIVVEQDGDSTTTVELPATLFAKAKGHDGEFSAWANLSGCSIVPPEGVLESASGDFFCRYAVTSQTDASDSHRRVALRIASTLKAELDGTAYAAPVAVPPAEKAAATHQPAPAQHHAAPVSWRNTVHQPGQGTAHMAAGTRPAVSPPVAVGGAAAPRASPGTQPKAALLREWLSESVTVSLPHPTSGSQLALPLRKIIEVMHAVDRAALLAGGGHILAADAAAACRAAFTPEQESAMTTATELGGWGDLITCLASAGFLHSAHGCLSAAFGRDGAGSRIPLPVLRAVKDAVRGITTSTGRSALEVTAEELFPHTHKFVGGCDSLFTLLQVLGCTDLQALLHSAEALPV